MVARRPPIVRTNPNDDVTQSTTPICVAYFSQIAQPAMTVVIASHLMTSATRRFLTTALMRTPEAGAVSAAAGPMKPANRNAEPNHRAPPTMWKSRSTIINGSNEHLPRAEPLR